MNEIETKIDWLTDVQRQTLHDAADIMDLIEANMGERGAIAFDSGDMYFVGFDKLAEKLRVL